MFAINLKKLRKKKGLKQQDLGNYLHVSQQAVAKWENGKSEPNLGSVQKLANLFEVSIDYLYTGSESENVYKDVFSVPGVLPLPETKKIPLIGNISCVTSVLAVENIDEYIKVNVDTPADFALRFSGDSMINARIFNNDIVFVREQPVVENGDIAAIVIENEVTLKRFYKLDECIELRAENPTYPPIIVPKSKAEGVRILGKAVAFMSCVI